MDEASIFMVGRKKPTVSAHEDMGEGGDKNLSAGDKNCDGAC